MTKDYQNYTSLIIVKFYGASCCEDVYSCHANVHLVINIQAGEDVYSRHANVHLVINIRTGEDALLFITVIKKGAQCKVVRKGLTPYLSEDPSPTIPTHRMKEEKAKTV